MQALAVHAAIGAEGSAAGGGMEAAAGAPPAGVTTYLLFGLGVRGMTVEQQRVLRAVLFTLAALLVRVVFGFAW
jgi:hypothetical protein